MSMIRRLAKLQNQGLLTDWGVLFIALGLSFVVVGSIAGFRQGGRGWAAAAAASAGACFLGAASAVVVCRCFRSAESAWKAVFRDWLQVRA